MACNEPTCQSWQLFDAACGKSGFGRDASLTFTSVSESMPTVMPSRSIGADVDDGKSASASTGVGGYTAVVSFLDLDGFDDPKKMVTRIAVLDVQYT